MRDSAADIGAAEKRPQEHREPAEESLRGGTASAAKRSGWTEPERSARLLGGVAGGDPHQEGRQHLRYPERQRPRAMTSGAAARVADATGNWVDTRAPSWSRPYLRLSRLDRPIGSWLLLMPCWWSAALAAGVTHDIRQLPLIIALFFVGAFAMRGAGCTWNDITDRDLDALVERTRSRPIPAGQVSVPQAMTFLVVQALIGLAVLLQFNRFAVATGLASLVIVAVYPFMKRITWWALIVFYAAAVVLIGVALALAGARWFAWIGLAAFAVHLVWQIRRLDISDPALCLRIFKSNRDAGLLLFAGLLVDAVMRANL